MQIVQSVEKSAGERKKLVNHFSKCYTVATEEKAFGM